MVDSIINGFKSAFTWHMFGQTLAQLIIAAALLILLWIVAALLFSDR